MLITGLWFHLHFILLFCNVRRKLGCYKIMKISLYLDIQECVIHHHLGVLLTFLPMCFHRQCLSPLAIQRGGYLETGIGSDLCVHTESCKSKGYQKNPVVYWHCQVNQKTVTSHHVFCSSYCSTSDPSHCMLWLPLSWTEQVNGKRKRWVVCAQRLSWWWWVSC